MLKMSYNKRTDQIMKIGILNLPIDNNFGGNLQRYALIKVLQELGHNPEHIQIRFAPNILPFPIRYLAYCKRLVKKLLFDHNEFILKEKLAYIRYLRSLDIIAPFYNKYIPHTEPCYCVEDIRKLHLYDIYIIGSDQVWRKTIAYKYLGVMMGETIPNHIKRIAYAVSFGTDENELTDSEISYYSDFYHKFSAVSIREETGLKLLKQYDWTEPEAIHLLDPTFLLNREDYKAIEDKDNNIDENILFCYILDVTKEKEAIIDAYSANTGLEPYVVSLNNSITIERWLTLFDKAEFVITDSFHGLVFSIIYNKPYRLIRNQFRGNARFDSVLNTFGLTDDGHDVDWKKVNKKIELYKKKSMEFLAKYID